MLIRVLIKGLGEQGDFHTCWGLDCGEAWFMSEGSSAGFFCCCCFVYVFCRFKQRLTRVRVMHCLRNLKCNVDI